MTPEILRFELPKSPWLRRDHGPPAECATYSELGLWVGDVCLTELVDIGLQTTRSRIRVSLNLPLQWLVENYWRLVFEPRERSSLDWQLSHRLAAIGHGFRWPDVTVIGDGERIGFQARSETRPRADLRFLTTAMLDVSRAEFDRALDGFARVVIGRAEAVGAYDIQPLADAWALLQRERADSVLSRLRRSEALLGLAPETVEPEDLQALRDRGAWMGAEAVDEVLAAGGIDHSATLMQKLRDLSVQPDATLDLATLDPLRDRSGRDAGAVAWQEGVRLATDLRARLGLDLGPVDLDGIVGTRLDRISTQPGRDIAAGFAASGGTSLGVVLRRASPTGRRFEVARLLGDALAHAAATPLLPVTDRATARQKLQRAFAQELLCPLEGLQARLDLPNPDPEQIKAAADWFQVSQWTVQTALVNRGLVPRDYLPQLYA